MNAKIKEKVLHDIFEYGISVIGTENEQFPFTYSIGAKNLDAPDLFMPYLNMQLAQDFINWTFYYLLKGDVNESCIIEGFAANNFKLAVIKIDNSFKNLIKREFMIQAHSFYKERDFDSYQLVMPDRNGLFPWEEGYTEFIPMGQKMFFEKRDSLKSLKTLKLEVPNNNQLQEVLVEKRKYIY